MGTISDFMQRLGSGILAIMRTVNDWPVHCYRCHKEFKFGDGALHSVYGIQAYERTFHQFCHDCIEAIYAEYPYRCAGCGKRHNLATFPICAECQALQYPREAKRIADQNMRAWEHGLEATLTMPEWLTTLNHWKWSCYYCGKPFEALDHHIPIARGGGTTANNCFPICKSCNSIKGASRPDDLVLPSPRSPERLLLIREYQRRRWPHALSNDSDSPATASGEGSDL